MSLMEPLFCLPQCCTLNWSQTHYSDMLLRSDNEGSAGNLIPDRARKEEERHCVGQWLFDPFSQSGCNCCLSHFQTENQPSFLSGTGSGEDQCKHLLGVKCGRGGSVRPSEPRGSDRSNTVVTHGAQRLI